MSHRATELSNLDWVRFELLVIEVLLGGDEYRQAYDKASDAAGRCAVCADIAYYRPGILDQLARACDGLGKRAEAAQHRATAARVTAELDAYELAMRTDTEGDTTQTDEANFGSEAASQVTQATPESTGSE